VGSPLCADPGFAQFAPRLGPHTHLAVEASGPTWAFVDTVAATGARVCVVDTRKTKLKAAYAAKTDRLDARRLADALRRESVVSLYVPPPPIRALREVCRSRHQLVRLRRRLVQAEVQTAEAQVRAHAQGDPSHRPSTAWWASGRCSP
jgi:transposase